MARLRLFYVSDLHGCERCFRKFLNAASVYQADALILGGDVGGKAIQPITRLRGGRFASTFLSRPYEVSEGQELDELSRMIADHGLYPCIAEPGELEERGSAGTLDDLFVELMRLRLQAWTELADQRLRPAGKPIYWMLGNDDPPELAAVLDAAPWGYNVDDTVLPLNDEHEMLSLGYSNPTPWNTFRELPEDQLAARLEALRAQVKAPEQAVLNIHVPPYDSGIDEAPLLDAELRVQTAVGQVKFVPAGSTAVRDLVESMQPLLGLHGHIHEAHGFRNIGRTLVVNPGSDYGTGSLDGVLVTLEGKRIKAHQFVRG